MAKHKPNELIDEDGRWTFRMMEIQLKLRTTVDRWLAKRGMECDAKTRRVFENALIGNPGSWSALMTVRESESATREWVFDEGEMRGLARRMCGGRPTGKELNRACGELAKWTRLAVHPSIATKDDFFEFHGNLSEDICYHDEWCEMYDSALMSNRLENLRQIDVVLAKRSFTEQVVYPWEVLEGAIIHLGVRLGNAGARDGA